MDKVAGQNYQLRDIEKFEDLHLKDDLLRGIYAYGFEYPSTIQRKAILPIIEDVM
jgi:translation initiation factor 4A